MAPKTFNVGIVGYGLSAKVFHIPLILALPSDFKLYGIVQRSPKPDNDASKDHPGTKSWRSVDEMYKDSEVDVVVITSIPSTHYAMCKDALEAGKHVVVEKPFVPTSKEADELIQIAKKSGNQLTVYQNRRWDSDYVTLRELLSKGTLGDIAEFETHFDRHRPDAPSGTPGSDHAWKTNDDLGNESIYDLGTHLIDQVYHAFGMPKSVTAFVGRQRRGVTEGPNDSHTVLLRYEGPLLVTVKAGIISPEEEQLRYWVRGTKGSFKKYHLDVQEDQLKEGLRPGDKNFAEDPESHFGILTTIESGKPARRVHPTIQPPTYVEYYRSFAQTLRGEVEVPVKAEDARDVLKIIEMAKQSSKEGRTIEV